MPLRDLTVFTQFSESTSEVSQKLTSSLNLPLPKVIEFCDQLPSQRSVPMAQPLAGFEKRIAQMRGLPSFTWAVSNYVPYGVKQMYDDFVKNCFPPSETIADIDKLMTKPAPLLIADMGALGCGLFAKSKILKGSPVCTYMGRLIPSDRAYDERANVSYTVGVRTSSTLTAVFQVNTDDSDPEIAIDRSELFPAFIDGSEYGNYGSFLQHLPSEEAVAGESDKEEIATANLITVGADYRYYPCYYFRAARDIEANEILGFDYGENYWKGKNNSPMLLDKYGNCLRLIKK